MLAELGDCAATAMLAIQHSTKNTAVTGQIIGAALGKVDNRARMAGY
jgi:hypothetical protein